VSLKYIHNRENDQIETVPELHIKRVNATLTWQ